MSDILSRNWHVRRGSVLKVKTMQTGSTSADPALWIDTDGTRQTGRLKNWWYSVTGDMGSFGLSRGIYPPNNQGAITPNFPLFPSPPLRACHEAAPLKPARGPGRAL